MQRLREFIAERLRFSRNSQSYWRFLPDFSWIPSRSWKWNWKSILPDRFWTPMGRNRLNWSTDYSQHSSFRKSTHLHAWFYAHYVCKVGRFHSGNWKSNRSLAFSSFPHLLHPKHEKYIFGILPGFFRWNYRWAGDCIWGLIGFQILVFTIIVPILGKSQPSLGKSAVRHRQIGPTFR